MKVYEIHVNYGQGWEHEITEDSLGEALDRLKEYRENCPEYPAKIFRKTLKVIVKYWRGTQQFEGKATTYLGAMRIASRNQNAYGPTFWDEHGQELHDDGIGLCYPDPVTSTVNGVLVERRQYAV